MTPAQITDAAFRPFSAMDHAAEALKAQEHEALMAATNHLVLAGRALKAIKDLPADLDMLHIYDVIGELAQYMERLRAERPGERMDLIVGNLIDAAEVAQDMLTNDDAEPADPSEYARDLRVLINSLDCA